MVSTPRLQTRDPILVNWHDTISLEGWHDAEDAHEAIPNEAMLHHTVGWFVSTTQNGIVVAQSMRLGDDPTYGELIKIPWGCITGISMLVEGVKLNVKRVAQSNRLRVG